MALFGNKEDKEAKKEEKLNQWMESHGLSGMKPEYAAILKPLGIIEASATIGSLGSSPAETTRDYLHVIKEQNWVIIRLLNDIANK